MRVGEAVGTAPPLDVGSGLEDEPDDVEDVLETNVATGGPGNVY